MTEQSGDSQSLIEKITSNTPLAIGIGATVALGTGFVLYKSFFSGSSADSEASKNTNNDKKSSGSSAKEEKSDLIAEVEQSSPVKRKRRSSGSTGSLPESQGEELAVEDFVVVEMTEDQEDGFVSPESGDSTQPAQGLELEDDEADETVVQIDAGESSAVQVKEESAQLNSQAETVESVAEQVESTPEPVVETAPEPVVETAPEPEVDTAPEPVVESTPEPAETVVEQIETAPEPEPVDVTPAPVEEVETAPEPEPVVVETAPEPVVETAPEPELDTAPEPVVESTPEPAETVVEQIETAPVEEATPVDEPVVETTPEPVEPIVEEATPVAEPVVETTPEPVEPIVEEATPVAEPVDTPETVEPEQLEEEKISLDLSNEEDAAVEITESQDPTLEIKEESILQSARDEPVTTEIEELQELEPELEEAEKPVEITESEPIQEIKEESMLESARDEPITAPETAETEELETLEEDETPVEMIESQEPTVEINEETAVLESTMDDSVVTVVSEQEIEHFELFGTFGHRSTTLIQITAWYSGVALTLNEDLEDVSGASPVLRTSSGDISGTASILRFVARNSTDFYGETPYEKSLVDSWLEWGYSNITALAEKELLPAQKIETGNWYTIKEAADTILDNLKDLHDHLQKNTFLASNHVSIADITLAFVITELFTEVYSKKQCSKFAAVNRWVSTVLNQPIVMVFSDPSRFTFRNQSAIPQNPPKK